MRDGIEQISEGLSDDEGYVICKVTLDDGYEVEGRCFRYGAMPAEKTARQAALEQAELLLQYRAWRDQAYPDAPAQKEAPELPPEDPLPRGMIVYYYEIAGGIHSSGMMAIVADVNPDRSLTLAVLAPNGTWHTRGGVPLLQGAPDLPADTTGVVGYAMRV